MRSFLSVGAVRHGAEPFEFGEDALASGSCAQLLADLSHSVSEHAASPPAGLGTDDLRADLFHDLLPRDRATVDRLQRARPRLGEHALQVAEVQAFILLAAFD